MMFKREVLNITGENYCPVIENTKTEKKTGPVEPPVSAGAAVETPDRRGEIFVLAANIYYRARRNTRARAAGIL
jgi:hypothetical protein